MDRDILGVLDYPRHDLCRVVRVRQNASRENAVVCRTGGQPTQAKDGRSPPEQVTRALRVAADDESTAGEDAYSFIFITDLFSAKCVNSCAASVFQTDSASAPRQSAHWLVATRGEAWQGCSVY